MKPAYVFNIVGGSVDGYNPHGVALCLSHLQYLTYLSSCKNNWYRHTPATPRARPQRLGKKYRSEPRSRRQIGHQQGFQPSKFAYDFVQVSNRADGKDKSDKAVLLGGPK